MMRENPAVRRAQDPDRERRDPALPHIGDQPMNLVTTVWLDASRTSVAIGRNRAQEAGHDA